MIEKTCLFDERLSWKAKGLHSYLMAKPDDWKPNKEHLKDEATDGKASVSSGMKELIKFGYAEQITVRDEATGRIIGHEIYVYEVPKDELKPECENQILAKNEIKPESDYPAEVKPSDWKTQRLENRTLISKESNKERNNNYSLSLGEKKEMNDRSFENEKFTFEECSAALAKAYQIRKENNAPLPVIDLNAESLDFYDKSRATGFRTKEGIPITNLESWAGVWLKNMVSYQEKEKAKGGKRGAAPTPKREQSLQDFQDEIHETVQSIMND
ncbi:MAG: hypothetical protein AAF740_08965 [Bacteroidota bacterium]